MRIVSLIQKGHNYNATDKNIKFMFMQSVFSMDLIEAPISVLSTTSCKFRCCLGSG